MSAGAVAVLELPFDGPWLARNSPARSVPSHGTDLLGTRYAIDFVAVDARRRTARSWDLGTLFGTEPPERFLAFGRPILAPVDGTVVAVHDGESDHEARRSPLSLVGYLAGQGARLRRGPAALAGNHVVIALADRPAFAVLAHLRRGSLAVAVGDAVRAGAPVGECGNSGNSTQPHVHVQVMDHPDPAVARGLPMLFDRFLERPRRGDPRGRRRALPEEASVVERGDDGRRAPGARTR